MCSCAWMVVWFNRTDGKRHLRPNVLGVSRGVGVLRRGATKVRKMRPRQRCCSVQVASPLSLLVSKVAVL